MERICLVEAGNFFVGFDAAIISSITSVEDLGEAEQSLFHLESFFRQSSPVFRTAKTTILSMTEESGVPDLLVDRVIGEVDYPERFELLPLLYPELARQCCPKLFVYENQPFLFFDAEGFSVVRNQLTSATGAISSTDWFLLPETDEIPPEITADNSSAAQVVDDFTEPVETIADSPKEGKDVEIFEQEAGHLEDEAVDIDSFVVNETDEVEPEFSGEPENLEKNGAGTHHAEESSVNSSPEEPTDEEFRKLVFWIIENYLGLENPANPELTVEDLPANIFQSQGVSKSILQEIISKTIRKCETTSDVELKEIMREMAA